MGNDSGDRLAVLGVVRVGGIDVDVDNGRVVGGFTLVWGVIVVVGVGDWVRCCGEIQTGFLSQEVNTVVSCHFKVLVQ